MIREGLIVESVIHCEPVRPRLDYKLFPGISRKKARKSILREKLEFQALKSVKLVWSWEWMERTMDFWVSRTYEYHGNICWWKIPKYEEIERCLWQQKFIVLFIFLLFTSRNVVKRISFVLTCSGFGGRHVRQTSKWQTDVWNNDVCTCRFDTWRCKIFVQSCDHCCQIQCSTTPESNTSRVSRKEEQKRDRPAWTQFDMILHQLEAFKIEIHEFISRQAECQIMDFVTQQYKLFHNIAACYAFLLSSEWIWEMFNNVNAELNRGSSERLPEVS